MRLMFRRKEKRKVNLGKFLKKYRLEKIKINMAAVSAELTFDRADEEAAWELYVEMLTRIIIQPLPSEDGDEKAALDSVYSLFPTTREILRRHGRKALQFSKIAIPVLNQVVRPFTAKWHRKCMAEDFFEDSKRKEFRRELENLQRELQKYNRMLADIANVEDLTDHEQTPFEITPTKKKGVQHD